MRKPFLTILGSIVLLIICFHPAAGDHEGEMRLFRGTATSGVLQINIQAYKGHWTDVCKDNVTSEILDPFCGHKTHLPLLRFLADDYRGMVYYKVSPQGYKQVYAECKESCNVLVYYANHYHQCNYFINPPVIICDRDDMRIRTRLVTIDDSNLSLLQVLYNGIALNICDRSFTWKDMKVMRKTASPSIRVNDTATYAPPWLGLPWAPECTGTEDNLLACKRVKYRGCSPNYPEPLLLPSTVALSPFIVGALGLFGYTSTHGVLKIFRQDRWIYIGAESFSSNASAQVACRQMGLPAEGATFEPIEGLVKVYRRIWHCVGYETSLGDCDDTPTTALTRSDRTILLTCRSGHVVRLRILSLTGGVLNSRKISGRILTASYKGMGNVCDDQFNRVAARVSCRTLGLHDEIAQRLPTQWTRRNFRSVIAWQIRCQGNETNLSQCHSIPLGGRCPDRDAVAIICPPPAQPGDTIEWHLAGRGATPRAGRVEVIYAGYRGSVWTVNGYGDNVARVICRYLGTSRPGYADMAVPVARYGKGLGLIWISGIWCSGSENDPMDCSHTGIGVEAYPAHAFELAVECGAYPVKTTTTTTAATTPTTRRTTMTIPWSRSTMTSEHWSRRTATTRAYPVKTTTTTTAATTPTTRRTTMTIPWSRSTMTSEHWSRSTATTRVHRVAVSLSPVKLVANSTIDVHLDGSIGRILFEYLWTRASICDSGFDRNAARVVCRQLGLHSEGAQVLTKHFWSDFPVDAFYWSIRCLGNETKLDLCQNLCYYSMCHHDKAIAIMCPPPFQLGDTVTWRLVGGATSREGRVELTNAGYPGSVYIDGGVEDNVAMVICRYLGASRPGYKDRVVSVTRYGAGSGLVWISGISCYGYEPDPLMCRRKDVDAGVNVGRELALQCGGSAATTPTIPATTVSTKSTAYMTTTTRAWPRRTTPFRPWTRRPSRPTTEHPAIDTPDFQLSSLSGAKYQMISIDSDMHTGVVAMYVAGVWHNFCSEDDTFNDYAAQVFCFSIGQPSIGASRIYSTKGLHALSSSWRLNVLCTGKETTLASCQHDAVTEGSCSRQSIVVVRCSSLTPDTDDDSQWITFTLAGAALAVIIAAGGILFVALRKRRRTRGGSYFSFVDEANIPNDYIPPKYEDLFPELHTISQPGTSQEPAPSRGDSPEQHEENYM